MNPSPQEHQFNPQIKSRRSFLENSAFGLGCIALSQLLARDELQASLSNKKDLSTSHQLNPRAPHFAPRAKNVIFLFMVGGPSQLETFDPKPVLQKLNGKPLPKSFNAEGLPLQFMRAVDGRLMGSPFPFTRHGKSGLEISSLFPKLAQHADDLAVVRSCYHDSFIHGPAITLLSTGSVLLGHPSVGAWVTYGLGSESDSLPAYIAMTDSGFRGGRVMYHSGFLPAIYQGTLLKNEGPPIQNLSRPKGIHQGDQRILLDQLSQWNERHRSTRPGDSRLEARISNYELAYRMQMAAPELMDIAGESQKTRELYGLSQGATQRFGSMCLYARRMVERGVRFVLLMNSDWDGHGECAKNHQNNASRIDQPIAALLTDLKQRGMLEDTLIVWAGEFGRTPVMQGSNGRDHSPYGFSAWLAGGGIQGGKVIGATDEIGFRAVEDKVHVHDFHATMLSLLGLNHRKLTYLFEGRERSLTDIGGNNDLAERLVST